MKQNKSLKLTVFNYCVAYNKDGTKKWSNTAMGPSETVSAIDSDSGTGKIVALKTNATGLQAGGWPMFAKDAKHTGR